jgi:hypothetical protein
MCVATAEAEAQQAALELQLVNILGVASPPPPHLATAIAPAATPGPAAPVASVFETSSIGYLHTHVVSI